jgi:hypothetical protein
MVLGGYAEIVVPAGENLTGFFEFEAAIRTRSGFDVVTPLKC